MNISSVPKPKGEKGFILISTYLLASVMVVVASSAYIKAVYESRHVDREMARVRSHYAAEAGIQSALAQVGTNAYTGFINTNTISVANFQSTGGQAVGSYTVTMNYPNQADWVIVTSSATVDGATRNMEGRIFLDSNLSKYMMYINLTNLYVGNNAKFGYSDGTNPQGVPANSADRMAMYFTGNWVSQGSNVDVWGDLNAQLGVQGDSTNRIHGDAYPGNFATDANGSVTSTGITGGMTVTDGFSDDTDRSGDGQITSADAPDIHDLTSTGGGDSHKTETLTPIDHNFYQTNNNIPAFGSTTQNRFLKFEESGDHTQIKEYTSATFSTEKAIYELPSSAIVYVKGDAYVKGQVKGRVSLVSSNSIYVDGDMTYSGGSPYSADATHSAAFLAKSKVYLRPDTVKVSGILYAENTNSSSNPVDASYNLSGNQVYSKAKLRTYGNIIANGQPNTSIYQDRIFGYDKNLKKYRPPGIPVQPLLMTVRES